MKNSTFKKYSSVQELGAEARKAMEKAIAMLDAAYAPYSEFKVGACAVTNSGQLFGGCNQENASYPLCICGERVALYHAGAVEPKEPIKLLAIVSHNAHKPVMKPVSPCGACRQVIAEFSNRHSQFFPIYLKGDSDEVIMFESVKELLPFMFDDSYL